MIVFRDKLLGESDVCLGAARALRRHREDMRGHRATRAVCVAVTRHVDHSPSCDGYRVLR